MVLEPISFSPVTINKNRECPQDPLVFCRCPTCRAIYMDCFDTSFLSEITLTPDERKHYSAYKEVVINRLEEKKKGVPVRLFSVCASLVDYGDYYEFQYIAITYTTPTATKTDFIDGDEWSRLVSAVKKEVKLSYLLDTWSAKIWWKGKPLFRKVNNESCE